MTSEERREARYQRRKEKREQKKRYDQRNITIDTVADCTHLYSSAYEAAKGVDWKASVKKYLLNICKHTIRIHNKIINGQDVRRGFICFRIIERGKPRDIKSVHFTERVAQKSLCKYALYPIFTRSIIYDNGASQKGKGTKFATERFVKYLVRHIRRHGRKGGILFIDFSNYFGNIDHDELYKIYEKLIADDRLREFAFLFVTAFDKGLGLGSETSQINAVIYRSGLDHYIKEVLRIKGYGAYMDDSYLIHEDIGYLKECLEKIRAYCGEHGMVINEKKTRICDLKHGFTYLKTRFYITESGKIIKKPCRDSITRERRKLKKQAKLLKEGTLTHEDIRASYASWKGSMKYRNAHRTVQDMDKLYSELFIKE